MTAPLTPTNLTPPSGSIVGTSNFMVSATLRPWPVRQKAQFQFAKDSNFTVNAHTSETGFRNPGSVTTTAGLPRLSQGAVFVRVRAIEEGSGDASPWSSPHELDVSHGGSALLVSPGRGAALPWVGGVVTFDWDFRDNCEYDTQTAYQIKVETNDDDSTYENLKLVYANYGGLAAVNDDYADIANSGGSATTYDSGKIISGATSRSVTLPALARNELVRWTVRTWDDDDQTSGYVTEFPLFVGDLPTVEITAPTVTADTPTPEVEWDYSSAAGHPQESFRVCFVNAGTGALLFDSGTQSGSVTSYIPPSGMLPNGIDVTITVDVVTATGMQQSDSVTVATQWLAPPNPSIEVVADDYERFARVDLDWLGASQDVTFVEWRVYRRNEEEADWKFLGATQDFGFIDHSAPPLATVQYAVTQVGVAFGVQVESTLFPIAADLTANTYMLKAKDEPSLVLELRNVTADDFTHEYEQEVMEIMGYGRKAEVGTAYGRKGTLNVQLRDMGIEGQAALAYTQLLAIKDSGLPCYLRIPFRDTFLVHIGNVSVKRLPGVTSELTDVSFEYTEITEQGEPQ